MLGFRAQQGVEKALEAVPSGEGLAYPRNYDLVMVAELVRTASVIPPPDAGAFGRLVPLGVVLRYEDISGDGPPPVDSAWFDGVVAGTIAWAKGHLSEKND